LSRSLSPDSLMPPRIDEGHKVFLPGAPGVLERELPADVYRRLEVIPAVARYHFLSRFLTMLVVRVFSTTSESTGLSGAIRAYRSALSDVPSRNRLASGLTRLQDLAA